MKTNMTTATLLVVLCCFHVASGDIHSMKYITTAVYGIIDFPEYTTVGQVDNRPFVYFDSNIKKMIPKTKWIEENVEANYWDLETQREAGGVPVFANNIQIAMQRFNQSTASGVHTYQWMYGCQWDDESGAVDASDQIGFDGEDFISLDLKNLRYISSNPQALITKNKWDINRAFLEGQKQYYTQICIEWLKKYMQYGSSTLGRTVSPEVTILQKDSSVVCHSTGFYPDGVMITWMRDGVDMHEDVDMGETLPNEDGTFQKRAELKVSPEERKKGEFTCEVAHKSGKPIVKILIVEDGKTPVGIIIGCVIAALVLIGVVVAIVMMKKKKDYNKAEQYDSGSDTSDPKGGAKQVDC